MIDYEFVTPAVRKAARIAHSSFPSHYDVSDTEQTLWIWVLENKGTIARITSDSEGSDRTLVWLLVRAANEFLKKEDAATYRYHEEDVFYYSASLIKKILEVVFHHEDWQSFASALDSQPKAKSDPSEGGNNLASYADVSSALNLLTDDQYNAIVWQYKYGRSIAAVGQEMGITKRAAQGLLDGAVSAIQKALGQRDLGELRNPPETASRPRGRADAMARLENQYGE